MRIFCRAFAFMLLAPCIIFPANTIVVDTAGTIMSAMIPTNEMIITRQSGDIPIEELAKPIKVTTEGLRCFLRHTYADPRYAEMIIPDSLEQMKELLKHGCDTNQPCEYTTAVLQLFRQKVKQAPYMSAPVVTEALHSMPEFCKYHFAQESGIIDAQSHRVKRILTTGLRERFDTFKTNPEAFLNDISTTIATALTTDTATVRSSTKNEVRFGLERFLETLIAKILWSPADKDAVWDSFTTLSKDIVQLRTQHPCFTVAAIDDMLWSLITRFEYFLKYAGNELPKSFYEKARTAMRTDMDHLDEIREQEEELLKTKRRYLQEALIVAAAKAQAQQVYGIISNPL